MAKKQGRTSPGATPGMVALVESGIPHRVHTYDHDESTSSDIGYGLEAAHALGVDPDRVFKTLMVDTPSGLVLGVVPVTAQLDLKAMAQAVGSKKVTLARPDVAQRVSGSVLGGISPLGGRTRLPLVLDETAGIHDTIFVSGGKRGVNVELAPADLLRLTGGSVADIARG